MFDWLSQDLTTVASTLSSNPLLIEERLANEKSPMHQACETGSIDLVKLLLSHSHAYNCIDDQGKTPAEYALSLGHKHIYEYLVQEGIRSELILREVVDADHPDDTYLQQRLVYEMADGKHRLLDADGNAVMMGWEAPLMKRHAELLLPKKGLAVMNVGFGLGIVDTEIQKHSPSLHVIVEAHPDVYAFLKSQGWTSKENVRVFFGKWQDVLPQLQIEGIEFDAIYYDTYSEYYEDFSDFCDAMIPMLKHDGVFSYFNGLGATNYFAHEIYRGVAEVDLKGMGLTIEWEAMDMTTSDKEWNGVRQQYWKLDTYWLPLCRYIQ